MAMSTSANVNKPMNPAERDSDINRKLQLYGILTAFQNGKVPSNDQIDVALNSFLASSAISNPSNRLSAEGQALVADFREVVQQAKLLLLSKNEGNLLQDFIWQTQQFDPKAVSVPGAPIDQETAKGHGKQALEGLRTLGTLLITNGQFRKLLQDAGLLIRDIAGDAATNTAAKVKPSADAMANIDAPADDNTWHDAPDLSKDKMRKQMQGLYGGKPAADAQAAVDSSTAVARDPNASTSQAAAAGANVIQQRVAEGIPDETKEDTRNKAAEYRARAKEYFSKKMPEERREQTVWRLKKMVLECQQHPDYQQAMQTLLTLAEEYGGHANKMAQGGAGTAQEARSSLAAAEADLKTLIERFANGTSTDGLWAAINQIYEDADRDEELRAWFTAMDRYIRRCLQEQGYIMDDASNQEWNRLYDHGNYLLRQKYRTHTDRIVDEIKFLADQFDVDAQNKAFGLAVQKLFTDLGNDENGKPTFKPHLIKDLTSVIIPTLCEKVAYIPVPRIEYSDPQIDAVVENLVLESDNFMPNILEVASEHYFHWGRKNLPSNQKQSIEITVKGVQMDLRDISYYIKRKQGFPAITDEGIASVLMAGEGFCFTIKVSTADAKDAQNFFKIDRVKVDIKDVHISLTKSKHKFLFNLFRPLMMKVMRPALQKVAEKAIRDQFDQMDRLMFQIKTEADRALEAARADPENIPNIYSRYVAAAQKQMMAGQKKVAEVTADKKVNVTMTTHDSILPHVKLPGTTSAKATEYKELAAKGDKWQSPVFSIGDAKKSNDVPKAPDVVRKHGAANGNATASTDEFATGGIAQAPAATGGYVTLNGNGNGTGNVNGSTTTRATANRPTGNPLARDMQP